MGPQKNDRHRRSSERRLLNDKRKVAPLSGDAASSGDAADGADGNENDRKNNRLSISHPIRGAEETAAAAVLWIIENSWTGIDLRLYCRHTYATVWDVGGGCRCGWWCADAADVSQSALAGAPRPQGVGGGGGGQGGGVGWRARSLNAGGSVLFFFVSPCGPFVFPFWCASFFFFFSFIFFFKRATSWSLALPMG